MQPNSIEEECPITVWRRVELRDVYEIQKIIKYPQIEELFGDRDIEEVIEKSNLSLCQENSVGRIVSFIALCDHPNIPALSSTVWLDWAKTLYGEEDNDDVIPILESQNEDLRKLYGDFYIAEMIANPDNDRQMVVAEHRHRAVGFMSMNTNIDFEMLNYHFEMAPFYGLRKPNENDDVCSPSMVPGDSVEGLILPSVIQSGDEISRLSVLSSVLEHDLTMIMPIPTIHSGDLSLQPSEERSSVMDSMESIIIDESLTSFASDEDLSTEKKEGVEEEEEDEEEIIVGKRMTVEQNEASFRVRSLDIPTYCGEPNAFMIELFAMHQDWDERMSPDFLEAAYECYPDLDYCIITLPPTCNTFPMLEHFVRVVPRPAQSFSHELYVCHRNSFLRPQEEMLYMQTHYDIEAYADLKMHKTDCHGILKHFTVSPIFNCHMRFFLSEILRLSEYTSLYYLHHHVTTEQHKIPDKNIVTSLKSMIPIKPRHQIHYDLEALKKNIPCPAVLRNENSFALYYMNNRYSSLPKLHINTRIVVIGASHTALAFLETLLFGPTSTYLTFNNITLVSPHGLPGEYQTDKASKKLFIHDGYYGEQHMAKLNFRTYINIIYGKMTGINRKEKHIVINHTSLVQYDYLMLFSGELFHLPFHFAMQDDSERCVHGRRKSIDEPIKEMPQNVFLINTEIDAANSMIALKHFINRRNHR